MAADAFFFPQGQSAPKRAVRANTFRQSPLGEQQLQSAGVRQQLELERIKDELRTELRAELLEMLRSELRHSFTPGALAPVMHGEEHAHPHQRRSMHRRSSSRAVHETLNSADAADTFVEAASEMHGTAPASAPISGKPVASKEAPLSPLAARLQATVDRFNEWNNRGSLHSVEEMPLERSMWSVTMLIGMPMLGDVASAYLVFLLGACVLMQGSIIAVLGASTMTSPDYNDNSVTALRSWRRNVAHHITNYDTLRGTSLTNTVCDLSTALSVSATIEADYRRVSQYLEYGQLVGSVMCVIALVAWYMTLGKEITSGAALADAPTRLLRPHQMLRDS